MSFVFLASSDSSYMSGQARSGGVRQQGSLLIAAATSTEERRPLLPELNPERLPPLFPRAGPAPQRRSGRPRLVEGREEAKKAKRSRM